MAGRPKQGIDFAGWSVDIFDGDKKIDKLLDGQGWKGFGVYFFLCQRAYKTNGYYCEWGYDDCATTARKMGGGIVSSTVQEAVSSCLQVGLFDKGLFDRWGILTSKGIQRRFWAVVSGRRVKSVYKEYWLLEPEECQGLVKVTLNQNAQPANDDLQPTNGHLQATNDHKVKESKVKDKNATHSRAKPGSPAGARDAHAEAETELLEQRFDAFWAAYPKKKSKESARRAWKKVSPDSELFERIMRSVREHAEKDRNWREEGGRFIPYPATWLNAGGWEDEIQEQPPRKTGRSAGNRFLNFDPVGTDYDAIARRKALERITPWQTREGG